MSTVIDEQYITIGHISLKIGKYFCDSLDRKKATKYYFNLATPKDYLIDSNKAFKSPKEAKKYAIGQLRKFAEKIFNTTKDSK
jgi:hypothetical protein